MILSGAELPPGRPFRFPGRAPPLLAVQGTADATNPPRFTQAFFESAPRPKFLLRLLGAGHLPPYTNEQPQLQIVERVSLAFLAAYLRHRFAALKTMRASATVPGIAQLVAYP